MSLGKLWEKNELDFDALKEKFTWHDFDQTAGWWCLPKGTLLLDDED